MAENGAVSLTPGALRLRWDVFLSFRGEDTRLTFTNDLYFSLEKLGVRVFRDDDGLRRGDDIARGLVSAIEDSAASIVIISPRYADSWWCLEELAKICEMEKLILPVFYRVKPSDVQRQSGPFGADLMKHERNKRFNENNIERWRKALEKVGRIDGWIVDVDREEAQAQEEVIRSLVKRVWNEVSKRPVGVAAHTVGLDSQVEKLTRMMDIPSNGTRVLGLHGKSGVGKTTLAKNLYDKFVHAFDGHSFIPNVRETLEGRRGLISLLNKLVHNLSLSNVHPVPDKVDAAISAIRWLVHGKRVLVVLDDVHDVSQLTVLLGSKEWFQEGSRIIITARDREVLRGHVDELFEVKELERHEALQLFSYHALRREKPTDSFRELSERIVNHIGGVPLALEVFGSFLYDKKGTKDWEVALHKILPSSNLQDIIKLSIDELDAEETCIFLDISCLLIKMEMKREDVVEILNGCGFRTEITIRNLITKSLIKITEDNTLWMHDQVCDMGRQIDQVDGTSRRLWCHNEIMTVFENEKGADSIQGIALDIENEEITDNLRGDTYFLENLGRKLLSVCPAYFKERYETFIQNQVEKRREATICTSSLHKMTSLRLLQINHVKLEGKFKFLPAELKWLQWKGCPLKALPFDYCPQELAVLDLSESPNIERVWSRLNNMVAEKLRVMNLRGCCNLTAIPDLSGHKNLEKLVLEGCTQLTKIHKSIGNMNKLLYLNLRGCSNLTELPSDLTGLKNLKNLNLSGCARIQELPEGIRSLRSLSELFADETAIPNLPESIYRLTKLEKLSLNSCKLLKGLPRVIGKLCSLKELSLDGSAIEELPDSLGSLGNLEKLSVTWCTSLTSIPDSIHNIRSLTELLINGSAIKELPASIGSLPNLKDLSLRECHNLTNLPDSIGGLASIVELRLDETSITDLPESIDTLKLLRKLEIRKCRSLAFLPASIGSLMTLTVLAIAEANIIELPESIGFLENLKILDLNRCKKLSKLPDSIGKLKSLHDLLMEETAVTELPDSIGMLSSLRRLKMAKDPRNSNPEQTVSCGTQEKTSFSVFPSSFSNLSLLNELDACAWIMRGKIPDDFEKLTSLAILNLAYNNITSLPSTLRGLSILKRLVLPHSKRLKSLPPLPSCLLELNIANCTALESLSDLSNLESLQELDLSNCPNISDIPGLNCLKSLRRLYMSGSNACFSTVKGRIAQLNLRSLYNLSMPGSQIPDCFSKEVVEFPHCRNRKIKCLILCVVVSLNHQILDEFSSHLPEIVEVQVKILRHGKETYFSNLPLSGLPQNNEDQVHMYLFPGYHPLVSELQHSYRIQVTKTTLESLKEVELKMSGFHLIFEGDEPFEEEEAHLMKVSSLNLEN